MQQTSRQETLPIVVTRKLTLVAFSLVLAQGGCTRAQTSDESGPAPADSVPTSAPIDTAVAPDTSAATPPITPSPTTTAQDTPPAGVSQSADTQASAAEQSPSPGGGKVSQMEYEGWRQYSVQCARCHGQDVLPNPVAANLLVSAAPGGPVASKEKFVQVVSEGREERGMPAFKAIMTPSQIEAVYAYVKARAEKRIPPGRPSAPSG
ncbi:MAG TPA: cytochrome c [Gemmatimonadales bacterium]|nr:cytochrome c [Gemmatimonadales bacterium]